MREIGDDAEPCEEGRRDWVEAGVGELRGEVLALEVHGDEGGGGWRVERRGGEEIQLPGLGGGVVDLEDAEGGRAIAEGEGVETGAKKDVLRGATGDGGGEGVLCEAGAGDDEGAEGVGVRAIGSGGRALELPSVERAKDGDSEGVGEDEGIGVDELMGGAAEGDAEGGAGWDSDLQGCAMVAGYSVKTGCLPAGVLLEVIQARVRAR